MDRPPPSSPASLRADLRALGGYGVAITELRDEAAETPAPPPGVVRIGVHRGGALPSDVAAFDLLLSTDPRAPRPWVGVGAEALDAELARLAAAVEAQPAAAAAAVQVLRMTLHLPFAEAVALESLAYSMLLASDGFLAWRRANPAKPQAADPRLRVIYQRTDDTIALRLDRPEVRNACDAAMRDALCEALEAAALDPGIPIHLSGEGPSFSAGGDLAEFGQATDVGEAHLIRALRSPARLAWAVRERLTARVHGACIGAGVEVPAAAGRVVAASDAFFALPELSMGLIPGAGGTATLPRRIGRRRTCYMALTGARIDAQRALAWGLVDAVEARA